MLATNYFEEKILGILSGQTATGAPKLYVGLYISSPTDTGVAGIEVSYAGYLRQEIIFDVTRDIGTNRGFSNINDISFSTITGTDAGVASYIGISDSLSGGNMLLHGKLESSLGLGVQERPNIAAGDITYWISSANATIAFKDMILNNLRGIDITGFQPRVGLYNGNPDSGGIELSGENYSRPEIVFSLPRQQTGGYAQIQNQHEVRFERPASVWGSWVGVCILAPVLGGGVPETGGLVQPIIFYPQTPTKTIAINNPVIIEAEKLIVKMD